VLRLPQSPPLTLDGDSENQAQIGPVRPKRHNGCTTKDRPSVSRARPSSSNRRRQRRGSSKASKPIGARRAQLGWRPSTAQGKGLSSQLTPCYLLDQEAQRGLGIGAGAGRGGSLAPLTRPPPLFYPTDGCMCVQAGRRADPGSAEAPLWATPDGGGVTNPPGDSQTTPPPGMSVEVVGSTE